MAEEISKRFEAALYGGKPYVSGEQPERPGLIKLNSNENPYPPSPAVRAAVAGFDTDTLRLYPRADGGILRTGLADYHAVARERVFVANGSDEVLALAFRACFNTESPILFADVTYSFYPVWCDLLRIPFRRVPVSGDLRLCAEDYAGANGGVVISNPNAPTSIGEGGDFAEKILSNNPDSVVILDEAYADFADFSAVSLTARYPNLLVTRSFSKSRSLAGMRIGYAVGGERLIAALETVKDSFNSYPIDSAAIAAGAASLADDAYYRSVIETIKRTRDHAARELRALGFDVPESSANFLFAGCGGAARAQAFFAALREAGVLVRYFGGGRTADRLRISIGTPEEMKALLDCAAAFCRKA
ncbi:MAG: aminotransferase class I/II-fold pyridoxal phosphate-dependent enzyme [Clostridiales Family XIII bacterium]|jgi:histidinol-phosphate aminotransferase|nr:aminotransferase class I/II-fold pyridoxal phosphate-dependent enzyme [Clostridiales Family XIII bacterium]